MVGLWFSECLYGGVNDGVCDVHDGMCVGVVVCDGVFDVVCDVVSSGVSYGGCDGVSGGGDVVDDGVVDLGFVECLILCCLGV